MNSSSKKNPPLSSRSPHPSVRPQIHNSLPSDKEAIEKIKRSGEEKMTKKKKKKTRRSFGVALKTFFSRKKSQPKLLSKPSETFLPPETPKEKRVEVKIRTPRSSFRFVLSLALPIGIVAALAPFSPLSGMKWFSTQNEAVRLYPATCLGGWENPKNAEGAPSLPKKSSSDQFNDRNSAVLRNSLAQIFCSDFVNVFPEGAFPKKMFLHFSWASVAPTISRVIEIPTKAAAATSSVVLDGPFMITEESASSSVSTENTETLPGTTTEKIEIEKDDPENLRTEQNNEEMYIIGTPPPVSFLHKFLSFAFAEPILAASTTKPSDAATSTASTTPETDSLDESESPSKSWDGADFLQVLYTLDGQNWKQLGMVTRENLADLSFQVPISDPTSLEHFQVSIQNVISLDEPPVIYLDSMWLEAGE